MASAHPSSSSSSAALPHRNAPFKSPIPTSSAPSGTFLPNTKVQVGSQRVIIEKYLSEGGFAHVYIVRVPRDNNKYELAVLKRVAVPDKDHLANMRTEVETMKKLKGHRKVVTYMDSHASQLKGGGYEVFLLMEYCSGGGLIDFMNTRLQHRLTEPEILKIFGDVSEGVACMHYLKPPLLHRDLKVENVLISKSASGTPTYKLCDFGSAAPPRPAAKSSEEGRLIEEDVQKHTTMQYRSPEMIDVWRKQSIDEKADIWALGVLLYKLCYYTTPFEDVGQMAILNASFKFPNSPNFSGRLRKLISTLLKENPKERPNIYQVIKEVCSMRGADVPIKDIYAQRTQSEARRNEVLPVPEQPMSVGLQKEVSQVQTQQAIPDIAPMRRGRPTAPAQQAAAVAANKPSPSPARGDPFAALDSKSYDVRAGAVDELSKKFPSLDEFSIAHGKGDAVSFDQTSPQKSKPALTSTDTKGGLNERVTNALADRVFSSSSPKTQVDAAKSPSISQLPPRQSSLPKSNTIKSKVRGITEPSPLVQQPTPVKGGVKYTSTGTGVSPPPTPSTKQLPEISSRPIWKVPSDHRSSSQPRASVHAQAAAASLQPSLPPAQRPGLLDIHRSKSQTATLNAARSPTSSRPSLEGHRPSQMELDEPSLSRAKSAQSRARPSSAYVNSNLDYLRDQEATRKRPSMEIRRLSRQASHDRDIAATEGTNIDDDIAYLRKSEDTEKRRSSGHKKLGSLGSLAGAKNIFAGRFGDAFKRFEHSSSDDKEPTLERSPATPEPRREDDDGEDRLLSPIEGSEATPSRHSDPDSTFDKTEDIPPDVRRELERRRLSQEERRVAEAAAEYRARVAAQDGATAPMVPQSRASTIQKRVQSLLDEVGQGQVDESWQRRAEAHEFRSTHTDSPLPQDFVYSPTTKSAPSVAKKPTRNPDTANMQYSKIRQPPSHAPSPAVPSQPASAPPAQAPARTVSRPSVPPKAQALRTGGSVKPQWPPPSQPDTEKPLPAKPSSGLAALLAKDLEGVPDYPPSAQDRPATTASRINATDTDGFGAQENLEADFSKRYPSLSGIEMVETEIEGRQGGMRMKEV